MAQVACLEVWAPRQPTGGRTEIRTFAWLAKTARRGPDGGLSEDMRAKLRMGMPTQKPDTS